jgi:hypothetical protein
LSYQQITLNIIVIFFYLFLIISYIKIKKS